MLFGHPRQAMAAASGGADRGDFDEFLANKGRLPPVTPALYLIDTSGMCRILQDKLCDDHDSQTVAAMTG